MRRVALWGVVSCLVLILAPAGIAQQTTGIIQGTVLDAAGGSWAGATVTGVNDDTGYSPHADEQRNGIYAFTELTPGRYPLKVIKDGFKSGRAEER